VKYDEITNSTDEIKKKFKPLVTSVKGAAVMMQISESHIRKLIVAKKLEVVRLSRRYSIPIKSIEALIYLNPKGHTKKDAIEDANEAMAIAKINNDAVSYVKALELKCSLLEDIEKTENSQTGENE